MKLTFFGGAKSVTGSCYMIEACGKKILIDCGLQQGRDEVDNAYLPFNPNQIDLVVVTHAHIDHSGRLPLLGKRGFSGEIITTRLTAELLQIMLRDSAHIQESDAAWENQKGKRAGRETVEPLYTLADAEATLNLIKTYDYERMFDLCPGIEARFIDAGHLLGSAFVELLIEENGVRRKIVFSGDIGNKEQPIIRDPQKIVEADYVVSESTYGNRNHEGDGNYTESLAQIMKETFARRGNVIMPSFAVGRTQEILYFMREIKERNLVSDYPDFPVYVDSPLAREATRIFSGDLTGYIDEDAEALIREGKMMLVFDGLNITQTTDESKALNTDPVPKVIISASGMADAGRIRHHLKHNLWRSESTVVFVGYQAEGSLGRQLLNGAETVKMFGEEIAVRARIVNFHGLSSHADRDGLIEWISSFDPKPRHVFAVHGDEDVIPVYVDTLVGLGLEAHAPDYKEVYDLISNEIAVPGVERPRKKTAAPKESPAFARLRAAGQQLLDVISRSRGGTNKDLGRFADQILALIKKWDR